MIRWATVGAHASRGVVIGIRWPLPESVTEITSASGRLFAGLRMRLSSKKSHSAAPGEIENSRVAVCLPSVISSAVGMVPDLHGFRVDEWFCVGFVGSVDRIDRGGELE